MSGVIKLRTVAQIEEDAAVWVWRMEEENVPAPLRTEFEDWLRRDSRHRRAYEELGGVWQALDGLAEAKREEKIATFVAEHERNVSGRQRRWFPWAAAATVLLAAGLFLWQQRGNESQALSTAVGQQRTVTLADGSTVSLNTNTILETDFARSARTIHLRKGEALFKVARDAQRPFMVVAGNTVIRAIGTEFNVRRGEDDGVQVVVAEGRVEVESGTGRSSRVALEGGTQPEAATTSAHMKRQLGAGQRIDAPSAGQRADRPGGDAPAVVSLEGRALEQALAWRDGAIVFDGEPLASAIAELNRYTDTRFVVVDPAVRGLKVGGRFKAGDVEGFLAALRRALPVETRRSAEGLVYIEAR